MKAFAVKPDHEYEEKNFMVIFFKIVMNHNSHIASKLRAITLIVLLIIDHGNVCDASKTALIGPTKQRQLEVKPWNA